MACNQLAYGGPAIASNFGGDGHHGVLDPAESKSGLIFEQRKLLHCHSIFVQAKNIPKTSGSDSQTKMPLTSCV